MNYSTVDIDDLNEMFLPSFLINAELLAVVNSISSPIKSLYNDTLYKMEHTGQVIYLEKMLNEFYQISGYNKNDHVATRKIYITNAPIVPNVYIYLPEENKPLYLGDDPIYLNPIQPQYNFIINVPSSLIYDEQTLRNKVNYYRDTKQFIIQSYV